MSVAFRRESDEEHKEPKFELPIPAGPNWVTARGHRMIVAAVAQWEAAVQAASDDDVRTAAQRDLRYWQTRLSTAQLAPPPPHDEVAIGARVGIEQRGKPRTLEIVGHDEADPAAGRIAFAAPLAQALIGGIVGETVTFNGIAVVIIAIDAIIDEGDGT